MNVRERVARAICTAEGGDPAALYYGEVEWHYWIRTADAAIAAILETPNPPEPKTQGGIDRESFLDGWTAGIAAYRSLIRGD